MRITKLNLFVIVSIGLLPFAVDANRTTNTDGRVAYDCNLITAYSVYSSKTYSTLPQKNLTIIEVAFSDCNDKDISTELKIFRGLCANAEHNCSLQLRSGDYEKMVINDCPISKLGMDQSNQFINKVSKKYNASQPMLEKFFVFDRILRMCLKSKLFHRLQKETFF